MSLLAETLHNAIVAHIEATKAYTDPKIWDQYHCRKADISIHKPYDPQYRRASKELPKIVNEVKRREARMVSTGKARARAARAAKEAGVSIAPPTISTDEPIDIFWGADMDVSSEKD